MSHIRMYDILQNSRRTQLISAIVNLQNGARFIPTSTEDPVDVEGQTINQSLF